MWLRLLQMRWVGMNILGRVFIFQMLDFIQDYIQLFCLLLQRLLLDLLALARDLRDVQRLFLLTDGQHRKVIGVIDFLAALK
jgi:hypothetical protein